MKKHEKRKKKKEKKNETVEMKLKESEVTTAQQYLKGTEYHE